MCGPKGISFKAFQRESIAGVYFSKWHSMPSFQDTCSYIHIRFMEKSLVKQSMLSYLVGGWATPLKNMTSSVGMMQSFSTEWKKTCSKPPTRYCPVLSPGIWWASLWCSIALAPSSCFRSCDMAIAATAMTYPAGFSWNALWIWVNNDTQSFRKP